MVWKQLRMSYDVPDRVGKIKEAGKKVGKKLEIRGHMER